MSFGDAGAADWGGAGAKQCDLCVGTAACLQVRCSDEVFRVGACVVLDAVEDVLDGAGDDSALVSVANLERRREAESAVVSDDHLGGAKLTLCIEAHADAAALRRELLWMLSDGLHTLTGFPAADSSLGPSMEYLQTSVGLFESTRRGQASVQEAIRRGSTQSRERLGQRKPAQDGGASGRGSARLPSACLAIRDDSRIVPLQRRHDGRLCAALCEKRRKIGASAAERNEKAFEHFTLAGAPCRWSPAWCPGRRLGRKCTAASSRGRRAMAWWAAQERTEQPIRYSATAALLSTKPQLGPVASRTLPFCCRLAKQPSFRKW